MKIQGIPRDATPGAARFAGGAGQAVQGFLQGVAGFQQVEAQKRALDLRERELKRQEALLRMSLDRNTLAYQRQRFQEGKALREEDRKRREQAAGQRASGSIFDALRVKYGSSGGQMPAGGVGPPSPSRSYIPPEIESAFQRVQADPDLSTDDRLKITEHLVGLGGAAARNAASLELAEQIKAEISSGFWTPENGLGLSLDVDADGKPDEWSDVPNKLLFLLGEGKVDPQEIAQIHEGIKRAGVQQRAETQRRLKVSGDARQQMEAMPLTPEAEFLVEEVMSEWDRGDFPAGSFGEQEFQRKLGAASQGMVFVEGKNGNRYAVPYDEAAQAEADLKEPTDPRLQQIEDFSSLADRVFPPFTPPRGDGTEPVSAQEIEAARDRYVSEKLEFLGQFLRRFGVSMDKPATASTASPDEIMSGIPRGRTEQPVPGPPARGMAPAPSTAAPAPAAGQPDEFSASLPEALRSKYEALPEEEKVKFRDMVRRQRGG